MGKTSREKNFLKSTFILAFGTFLPKLASFITLPIYTGELTKDEYGTFDLITVLCTLLLPVATLQVQSAVFRFLVDYRDNREKQNAIITLLYVFVIPVSIVVLIILYFALYKLSAHPHNHLLFCRYPACRDQTGRKRTFQKPYLFCQRHYQFVPEYDSGHHSARLL